VTAGARVLFPDLNLLAVIRSPSWTQVVRDAVCDIGAFPIRTCGARDAVFTLASTSVRYSHLLVECGCADGLLDTPVDLTDGSVGSNTELLLLGACAAVPSGIGIVRLADRSSVREALMVPPPARDLPEPPMQVAELRAALANSMIEARYQPIVRIKDGCPIAFEALARLNHPSLGTILPDRFVPQIEDAGLAPELTELISACAFADMTGTGLADLGLGITLNFPLDVLLQPEALDRLEAQRLAAGIPARQVVVELTESRPVEDFDLLRKSLDHLRGMGYLVAIDDVGPAVPRLAPLLDLPFTGLKLDKDLVQRIEHDPEIEDFLRATTAQAHAHGLSVVAEGVESRVILERIRAIGADYAQGFLAARPLPIGAVPVWLDAWRHAPAF
jgi:EAL domain-containing protein (putative c-di-GMP-specific phosphodiesterase class I)